MCGDRRFGFQALPFAVLAATSCAVAFAQPHIDTLQASLPGAGASNVNRVTVNAPTPNGIWIYLNGQFLPAASHVVNWVDTTNGTTVQLVIQGSPTNTQIVAAVPLTLFTGVNPATVQINVLENGVPSNNAQFFIVPPPSNAPSMPNAFVGATYGPVAGIINGTPPFQSGSFSGLPPGIVYNLTTGQVFSNPTVLSPPGLYTAASPVSDFWGVSFNLSTTIQSIGTPTFGIFFSSSTFNYPYGTLTNLAMPILPINANPPFSPNIVRFLDNNTILGTVSVNPATGLATLSNVFLTVGVHNNIKVAFLGDQNWQAATAGPFTITVAQAAPSAAFNGSATGTYGQTIGSSILTITTQSAPAQLPSGSVTISSGATTITTINNINPNGVLTPINLAGVQLPASIGAGAQTLSFSYSGDINYLPQTGSTPLIVAKALPTVSLTVGSNPIGAGQTEVLSTLVKAPGLGIPGGTVIFMDGINPLPSGTVNLNGSGSAIYSTTSLSAGTHNLSVNYPGDSNFFPSESAVTALTVSLLPLAFTTTSLPAGVAFKPYVGATVGVNGGTPPYTYAITGLPAGMSYNSQTGAIFGTPNAAGTFQVNVSVTDSANGKINTGLPLNISLPAVSFVTPSKLPDGTVGVGYTTTIAINGGSTPIVYSVSGTLPPGLRFIPGGSDALVTGTPTTVGTYTFTARVSDGANTSDSRDFIITIKPAPLSIPGGPTAPTGTPGVPFKVDFGCTGGVPPYQYSVTGSLPPGVTFANCVLSGTPTTPGTFLSHIQITDSTGASVTRDVTIIIGSAGLALPGGSLPDGQVGVAYKATVSATGGVPPIKYTSTALPDGLSMSTAGDITGTPTTAGQFSVRVTATDSSPSSVPFSVSAAYSITITPPTLAFGPATLPDGTVGVAYSGLLTATGGFKPYRFGATSLPDGLTVATDGTVRGTPTTAGTFTVIATVNDAAEGVARQTYTIKIAPPPLVIQTASAPNGTVGTAYSTTFTATGGSPPYTFTATGQPSTLIMSTAGTLSGTPTAPATLTVVVTVKDGSGASVSKSFPISVFLPPSPPLNFAGINTTVNALQQPRVSVSLASPYPVDVQVTLTLTFRPDSGPVDPAVVFSTGGTTATLTIPAGSLNSATDVGVQTGTVAGTITITAKLNASGVDVTPSPAPSSTTRIAPGPPVIVSATATRTATGFNVTVIGYSTSREMTSGVFGFNGSNLGTTSLTVTVDTLFSGWLGGNAPPSAQFGSQFTYTQPFTVNGTNTSITSVSVTLNNRLGASNTVTATLQ